MPEISVIMLTYNRANLLERSIQSIMAQTFKDFEFIIVDNGSTDGSANICDKWAGRDVRIKVVHRERGSIGVGRNTGLDAAKGKYITFVDDDDTFAGDLLEFLYELACRHDADIAMCGAVRETGDEIAPKFVFEEEIVLNTAQGLHELLRRKYFNSAFPTKLIKKAILKEFRFREDAKYEDIFACYKCFALAERIVIKGDVKYYFYRHEGNNSGFTTNDTLLSKEQLREYLDAFRERTVYLSDKFPQEAAYYRYTEWSYMISMCHKLLVTKNVRCTEIYGNMKNILMANRVELEKGKYLLDFERDWLKEIEEKELWVK